MKSKVLVTTAIETTWPINKDSVIFLGEWCLRQDRKKTWQDIDYEVAEYHWDDREKFYEDYQYLNALHESLLLDMKHYLNSFHQTSYSLRYWRLLVGPWMGLLIPILFDRWTMLKNVIKDNNIDSMYFVNGRLDDFIARDTKQYAEFCMSDEWNQIIYSELASHLGIKQQERTDRNDIKPTVENKPNTGFKKVMKAFLMKLVNFLSLGLQSKNDVFVISSYLSVIQSIKFHLKLGQFPSYWVPIEPYFEEQINYTNRLKLQKCDDSFRKITLAMLKRHIPIIFLEGYKKSQVTAHKLPWPSSPTSIITAISWNTDDLFKLWAGEKIEQGAPLITLQHGGNYGSAKFNFFEEHQIKISDQFLTWGWKDNVNKNVIPFCNQKLLEKNIQYSKCGNLLLIGLTFPSFSYHMYSTVVAKGQINQHFNDQISLLQSLPKNILKQVTVRIEPGFGDHQRGQWVEKLSQFPISLEDSSDCSIENSWRSSRICVATYNATVFLETMLLGIPTLMFWNPKHWELRDSAVPYFELLQDVGIFHPTADTAAEHLTEIWDDIDGWWNSEPVLSARNRFCNKYSRRIEAPLNLLKSLARKH